MSQHSAAADLEVLFIEKLQQKYKLNERDLKKAFSRFDKDSNGLLDIEELGVAVRLMLNGISDEQVRSLVKRFDLNGDGKISYDEFLQYLLSRKDAPTTAAKEANDVRYARRSGGSTVPQKYESAGGTSRSDRQSGQRESSSSRDRDYSSNIDRSRNGAGFREFRGGREASNSDDEDSVIDNDDYNDDNDDEEQYDKYPISAEQRGLIRDAPYPTKQSGGRRGHRDDDDQSTASEAPSEAPSAFDPSSSSEVEHRCKVFLVNLRSLLNKKVTSLRDKGALAHHLTMSSRELLEKTSCSLLSKAFQSCSGGGGGTRARKEDQLVGLGDFMRVLREFKFPGFPPVRTEVLRYLFELCRHTPSVAPKGPPVGRWDLSNGDPGSADPNLLFDLLYGDSHDNIRQQQLPRNQEPGAVGEQSGQRVRDRDLLKSYPDRANHNRKDLGRGPLRPDTTLGLERNKEDGLAAIPLRFISRKTYTSLAAPANFDVKLLKRSATLPAVQCIRDHVFGLSHSVTGTPIHILPSQARAACRPSPSSTMRTKGDSGKWAPSSGTNASLVYASAALGVIHDLATNEQTLFAGHDDDITCIGLSNNGQLAATGQTGKSPVIHVWRTALAPSSGTSSSGGRRARPAKADSDTAEGECNLVVTLGKGFFSRSVCAVSFCSDDIFLAGIGCDDHHSMGIWSIPAGNLLIQTVCQNGLPPQIRDLRWSPGQQFTEFITREHSGPCDLLCTAGERHMRIWSFSRPAPGPPAAVVGGKPLGPQPPVAASLVYRGATMGKSGATAAKVYTCCGFVPCDEKGDKSFDMVAGGSNGVVYLWRGGELAVFTNAIRGGVLCLHVPPGAGDKIFCGGAKGVIKVLDSRTLTVLAAFSTRPTTASIGRAEGWDLESADGSEDMGGRRPPSRGALSSFSRPAARAASAGRLRPSSATATPATKGRAAFTGASASDAASEAVLADVTGIVTGSGMGRSSASQSLAASQSLYVIATNSDGRTVRLDVGNTLSSSTTGRGGVSRGASRGAAGGEDGSKAPLKDLFHYHTGSVWGVSTERRQGGTLIASVGEDKQLCVWDTEGRYLTCRVTLSAAAHCCHFDKHSNFVAVGSMAGGVSIYSHLVKGGSPVLRECCFRKDFQEEVSDIKFSPANTCLAVGSHDDFIIVYTCALTVDDTNRNDSTGSCVLRPLHKLRGHSAYITHLDWSIDGRLLRSTCGAYELLFWDAESGKRHFDSTACDIRWKTNTCTLGFQVMGIWPKYADGTDINAVDVCNELGVVATADDSGYLNLLHFPSVVQEAPRRTYGGHSSFVQNVRFLPTPSSAEAEQRLVSVGGDDNAVIVWTVRDA